jgi:hypothetical protein
MITVEVTAMVQYTCKLSEEDSERVKEFAKENDIDLAVAVHELYSVNEIDLYHHSTESDFSTESIDFAYEEDELIRRQISFW